MSEPEILAFSVGALVVSVVLIIVVLAAIKGR
jgi:hypothetical protein